jgi:hypothetical protein
MHLFSIENKTFLYSRHSDTTCEQVKISCKTWLQKVPTFDSYVLYVSAHWHWAKCAQTRILETTGDENDVVFFYPQTSHLWNIWMWLRISLFKYASALWKFYFSLTSQYRNFLQRFATPILASGSGFAVWNSWEMDVFQGRPTSTNICYFFFFLYILNYLKCSPHPIQNLKLQFSVLSSPMFKPEIYNLESKKLLVIKHFKFQSDDLCSFSLSCYGYTSVIVTHRRNLISV